MKYGREWNCYLLQVFCPTHEHEQGLIGQTACKAEKGGMDLLIGTKMVELFEYLCLFLHLGYGLTRMSRASSALCQIKAVDVG